MTGCVLCLDESHVATPCDRTQPGVPPLHLGDGRHPLEGRQAQGREGRLQRQRLLPHPQDPQRAPGSQRDGRQDRQVHQLRPGTAGETEGAERTQQGS